MLIGMRNALMAGGVGLSAKSYVQDGLVAMWDGIENAGWGVHDESANTWKNLVADDFDLNVNNYQAGTRAAEFTGNCLERVNRNFAVGAIYNGKPECECIEFCGDAWDCMFCYTFLPSNIVSNVRYASISDNMIRVAKINEDHYYINMGSGWTHRPLTLTINYTASDSYTVESVFVNGEQKTMIKGGNGQNAAGYFCLMGRDNNPYYFPAGQKTFRCALRSRALTAYEIAANYAVDKARFNLPDAT